MFTPRRSSRLKAKDQKKRRTSEALRSRRRRTGGNEGFLSSGSEGVEGESSAECESSSDGERVVSVTRTPKVNNFIKEYHSYNRDYGLDCYERDFIDDSEICQKKEFGKADRKPERRKRRRRERGRGDIYSSESEKGGSPEPGKLTPCMRGRKGCSRRRINISGSSSGSDSDGACLRPHMNKQGSVGGRYSGSGGEEEEEEVVGGRKRRSMAQLESGSESSEEGGGRRRRRKYRKLESDEEISPATESRCPSSRALKLRQQKEKKSKRILEKLRMQRARQKGGSNESDVIDSDTVLSDEEDETSHEMTEEDWDVDNGCPPCPSPARELTQILFPDSESSGEESDWLVSDSEDITMSHTVGLDEVAGHERNWETLFSTRHLFSDSLSTINADSWIQDTREEADAIKMDESGLCPLIYAAGCANPALFSSLLTRTDLSSVFSILEESNTTLLQVIVEAPLASRSALERTHSVQTPVDKDASMASLGEEDHGTIDHRDAEGERGCGTIDAPRTCTVEEEDAKGEREHGVCRSIEISLTSTVDQEDGEGNEHYGTMDVPSSTHGSTVDSDSLHCLEALQAYDSSLFTRLLGESCKRHPTILETAVRHCKPKCLEFLINSGVSPRNNGFTGVEILSDNSFETSLDFSEDVPPPPSLLHQAVLCHCGYREGVRDVDVLEKLLPQLKDELESVDSQGNTPLMVAADTGNSTALLLLLEQGASINCRDPVGTSPLHLAAVSGWVGCVEVLISHGHPVDCRDAKGWPPLLYAHFVDHQDCVLALMRAKPAQLSVLSDLLKRTPDDGTDARKKTTRVVRTLLVSLAHHEAYFSLFNDFVHLNPSVLEDDSFGFMKHCMALLNFENKQTWFRNKLQKLREHVNITHRYTLGCHPLQLHSISRHDLLQSTYKELHDATAIQCWLQPLHVTFKNEAGICSGPRREFWSCLSRALADGEGRVFHRCDDGQLSLQPCVVFSKYCKALTSATVLEDHMKLLQWVGMLVAFVVFHGDTVTFNLTKPLIKQLLGLPLTHPSDMEYVDREFYHCLSEWLQTEGISGTALNQALHSRFQTYNMKSGTESLGLKRKVALFPGASLSPITYNISIPQAIKSWEVGKAWEQVGQRDDLELTFTCTLLCPWDGQSIDTPLVEDGRSKIVTEDNKEEYVNQVSHFKLETAIKEELHAFVTGFWKVVPQRCLQVFTPNELSLILSGVPKIDVKDWQRNTEYRGLNESHKIIVWFWRLVHSLKEEEKALLLKFATGSPRVPASGFASLQGLGGPTKFTVSLISGIDKIPHASTCFNNLKLSMYSCEQELRDKALIAIRYGCEGFEFS